MKFLSSEKAVSEVIGYAIILGMSITGVAMIVLVGVPSIYKLQDMSTVRNVEQTFTMSGSQASGTLLGDAPQRVVNINPGGGVVTVEPNRTGMESYIVVKSANGTFNVTVPMGKVKYNYGDRIIGYEGGGIWSKYPSGGSVMISPPEFHFDGRTLTFAVLTVNGNTTFGGKGTAAVTFKKNSTMVLFPNTTIDKNRTNPLNFSDSGKVYVNVTSEFYDAWADYARSLSYTSIRTDPTNRTASIELKVVPSTMGGSTVITNPISFPGLDPANPAPLDNFSFKLIPPGKKVGGNMKYDKLDWDMRAKSGNKTLIYYFKSVGDWKDGNKVDLSIGYLDTDLSSNDKGETWVGSGMYTIKSDYYIYVNLLSNSTSLLYDEKEVGSTNSEHCKVNDVEKVHGTADPDYSWNGLDYSWNDLIITPSNANNTQLLSNITQHYFWEMAQSGGIFFTQCAPSDEDKHGPDLTNSSMIVNYSVSGDLTFMHISNNIADVDIN